MFGVFILCVCVCARVSGFNGRLAYRMDSGALKCLRARPYPQTAKNVTHLLEVC